MLAPLGKLGAAVRRSNIVALALFLFAAGPSPLTSAVQARARIGAVCGGDFYVNSSGHCVRRPVEAPSAPAGASARCRDGTYSFSEHRRGTCSHHGGVAEWL